MKSKVFNFLVGLLLSTAALGQSVVTYPASGHAATEEWVQNYVFDMMEKYVKADCNLRVTEVVQDGNAVEFGLTIDLQGINQYTIKVQNEENKWWWYSVPYTVGTRLRIEDVPSLDSLRVTIRPTQAPTCYVSFALNAASGSTPDPNPPTDPVLLPCPQGPTILNVYNVTPEAATVQFHGKDVTLIDYEVINSSGNIIREEQVVPRTSILSIGFDPALPSGSYTLKFKGGNCTGSSTYSFQL